MLEELKKIPGVRMWMWSFQLRTLCIERKNEEKECVYVHVRGKEAIMVFNLIYWERNNVAVYFHVNSRLRVLIRKDHCKREVRACTIMSTVCGKTKWENCSRYLPIKQ